MRKLFAAAAAAVTVPFLLATPTAQASPGQCGGGGFIGGGSFCDTDPWPDGSFWHCVTGWGPFAWGSNCNRVCEGFPPPITDNDPRTPC